MQFCLYGADGAPIGSSVTNPGVTVTQGIFTVQLDFGAAAFDGADRFLEIGVRPSGSANAFTLLAPRQQITSAPYAIRSLNATNADTATTATNSTQLGGAAASQLVQTTDARLSDTRNPTAGSVNYIQNTTTQQTGANFNIGSTGAANIFNAQTQYNISNNRVLSIAGSNNLFAGVGAGTANTTGNSNTVAGANAGFSNQTGYGNSFFGSNAGNATISFQNSFFGASAGSSNTTGSYNTMLGYAASANVNNLDHATAVGAEAVVSASNTIALGRTAGQDGVRVPGLLQVGSIGSTAFTAKLVITGAGAYNAATAPRFDIYNTAAGTGFLQNVTDGGLFQIAATGGTTRLAIDGAGNVGIGTVTPRASLDIGGNVVQNLSANGLVKALVYLHSGGTIIRCFNAVTNSSTGGCGFSSSRLSQGNYRINFGFQVDNRFLSVTANDCANLTVDCFSAEKPIRQISKLDFIQF